LLLLVVATAVPVLRIDTETSALFAWFDPLRAEPRAWTAQETPAAANDAAALAKQLSNPVASLISFPLQVNYDSGLGLTGDGERIVVNVQPVVPFSLDEEWNLISRTILPIVDQSDIVPGTSQSGIGDVVQSLFLSPVAPTPGGWIWGAGPVFLIPTASDDLLGSEKWGIGPTVVALRQSGPWTYGALANHIVSFAGDDDRADVNATSLQPFVSYTTPKAWTYALNTESTYDWERESWSVPVNATISGVVRLGDLPLSIVAGVRWWADEPPGGSDELGYRFAPTPMFPR
jgi:hypothetical protein